jgi:predicted adenylyl cyclase CyaB
VEIKCPLADREAVEDRLGKLGAGWHWTRPQTDTFYAVPIGWLKLREQAGDAELISYRRPTDDAGPRTSEYDVLPVEDPELVKRLLARVLPVDVVVRKTRTLWVHGHTRIHLDRVEGLGDFVELETVVDGITEEEARAEADRLIDALELPREEFLAVPYRDLPRPEKT